MALADREVLELVRRNVGAEAGRQRAARGCYMRVLDDIGDRGFKVTRRVQSLVWDELTRIEREAVGSARVGWKVSAGPSAEALAEADLDRRPGFYWVKRSRHLGLEVAQWVVESAQPDGCYWLAPGVSGPVRSVELLWIGERRLDVPVHCLA